MFGIRYRLQSAARRAGLLSGGLVLCAVGAGFMTASAWIALVPVGGAAYAARAISCAYFGVGLIMIGASRRHYVVPTHHVATPAAQTPFSPPMMQAFMYGVQAGAQANHRRH